MKTSKICAFIVFVFVLVGTATTSHAVSITMNGALVAGGAAGNLINVNVTNGGFTLTGNLVALQAGGLDQLIYTGIITNTNATAASVDVTFSSVQGAISDFRTLPVATYAASLLVQGSVITADQTATAAPGDTFAIGARALNSALLGAFAFNGATDGISYVLGPDVQPGACGSDVGDTFPCNPSLVITAHLTLNAGEAFDFPITLSQTTTPVPAAPTLLLVLSGLVGLVARKRLS